MRKKYLTFEIIKWYAVIISIVQLYISFTGVREPLSYRAVHLTLLGSLYFLMDMRDGIKVKKIIMAGFMLATGFYVIFNAERLSFRWPMISEVLTIEIIMGTILILLLLHLTYIKVSKPLFLIAVAFLAYAFLGKYLPGILKHPGVSFSHAIDIMYLSTDGIFGVALNASLLYIFPFLIFSAFLNEAGGGQFFADISSAIAGGKRGGPAKVAVIASSLFGTISGSPTANVVTTGVITIPMMKRLGYKASFAGAVEAAASTGGGIAPPIMGSAAFLMAEFTGIPYARIMVAAALPAFLYYISLFFQIDLYSARNKLGGLPKEDIPPIKETLKKGWYLALPLIVVVTVLLTGSTASDAALKATAATFIVSWFRKETRLTPLKVKAALEQAAFTGASIAVICGTIGIVTSMLLQGGVAGKISSYVLSNIGTSPIIVLFLTMVICIVLGMGVPVTASYVLASAIVAPSLVAGGMSLMAVHLFMIYYCVLSHITPPVMVATFAAAAIAEATPIRTGITACKLAIVGFFVPYMFIFQPALLMQGNVLRVILALVTAIIGAYGISAGLQGWWGKYSIGIFKSIISLIGGIFLIYSGIYTDIVGFSIVVFMILSNKLKSPKEKRL